jgi:7-cyano-7-deazaguanine synthase
MPVGAKAVLLFSGGMDSAVVAADARRRGRKLFGLTIDYGQSHSAEIACARRQAKALGFERHVVLKLPLGAVASGALVDGSAINTQGPSRGKPSTYVSFRNGVFLAAAASWAEAVEAREIWGGWCFTDQAGYPDCRPEFFRAFEAAVRSGTWAGKKGRPFRIVAPLGRLDKAATVRLGLRLGVDFGSTWTCYKPVAKGRRPCGVCDACRLRAEGFQAARVLDPLSSVAKFSAAPLPLRKRP